MTMVIGGIMYATYIATYFYLHDALLYTGSAILGVGAAFIWTAQVRNGLFSYLLYQNNLQKKHFLLLTEKYKILQQQ